LPGESLCLDARFFVTAVSDAARSRRQPCRSARQPRRRHRDRFKVKRQVQVLSAHGRITGWVLGSLPPALAVATFVLNPKHLGTLMDDPLGQRMIMVAIVLQILGVLAIRKLVDIEY
jgi:tight adherence protein B